MALSHPIKWYRSSERSDRIHDKFRSTNAQDKFINNGLWTSVFVFVFGKVVFQPMSDCWSSSTLEKPCNADFRQKTVEIWVFRFPRKGWFCTDKPMNLKTKTLIWTHVWFTIICSRAWSTGVCLCRLSRNTPHAGTVPSPTFECLARQKWSSVLMQEKITVNKNIVNCSTLI